MSTEPCASSTAGDVKFSDAISWIVVFWRSSSRSMMAAISGSVLSSGRGHRRVSSIFDLGDLVDPALVAAAFELGVEEDPRDLLGQLGRDDPRADREHVGVVVLARHARGVEIVAERGARAVHLVGRDLLALAAAAEHDADDRRRRRTTARADRRAVRRVVDRVSVLSVPRSSTVVAPRPAARRRGAA